MNALRALDARAKILFLVVFILVTLHAREFPALGMCVGAALLLAVVVRLEPRTVAAVLLPLAPILVFTMGMQALTIQEGAVLFQIGAFKLTEAALVESLRMIACLVSLMLVSVSFMRCTSLEDLLALLDGLLAPLRALGVRTDGFTLALSVALGFAPVLVGEFRQLRVAQQARAARFDGGMAARLNAYAKLFPPLLNSAFVHADTLAAAFLARGFSCGAAPTRLHAAHFGVPEAVCLAATALMVVLAFA